MKIFKSFNVLNKEVNFSKNIGFVPTMGSLHDGHLSLIKNAKKKTDSVLAKKNRDCFSGFPTLNGSKCFGKSHICS